MKKLEKKNVEDAKSQPKNLVLWTSKESKMVTPSFLTVYIENWNTGKGKERTNKRSVCWRKFIVIFVK